MKLCRAQPVEVGARRGSVGGALTADFGGGGEASFFPIRASLLGPDFDKVVDLAKQGGSAALAAVFDKG